MILGIETELKPFSTLMEKSTLTISCFMLKTRSKSLLIVLREISRIFIAIKSMCIGGHFIYVVPIVILIMISLEEWNLLKTMSGTMYTCQCCQLYLFTKLIWRNFSIRVQWPKSRLSFSKYLYLIILNTQFLLKLEFGLLEIGKIKIFTLWNYPKSKLVQFFGSQIHENLHFSFPNLHKIRILSTFLKVMFRLGALYLFSIKQVHVEKLMY